MATVGHKWCDFRLELIRSMGDLTLNGLVYNLAYYISVTKLKVPNYLTIHSATCIFFPKTKTKQNKKKTVNGQVSVFAPVGFWWLI